MKQFVENRGVFIANFGLAAASFAAFLEIMSMNRPSELAITAVNDFSIGIPFSLVFFLIPFGEEWPQYIQMSIKSLNFIFILLGSFFCLLGLHKCFALVSEKASMNFAVFGVLVFLLIFGTGIYELILKDQKLKPQDDVIENRLKKNNNK